MAASKSSSDLDEHEFLQRTLHRDVANLAYIAQIAFVEQNIGASAECRSPLPYCPQNRPEPL